MPEYNCISRVDNTPLVRKNLGKSGGNVPLLFKTLPDEL
jgi:hypothetical protein